MSVELNRVLIIHPDAETRAAVEQVLRRVGGAARSIQQSGSLSEGYEMARRQDPQLVLVDLSEERGLALDVARGLRSADCTIVGLYNPLVLKDGEVDFFRAAVRAGVADFVPLPVADAELRGALEAAERGRGDYRKPEGRVVSFFSPKGGVGKTTLAVNTAVVLSASELTHGEVALVDADLQFGDAAAHLGLAPEHDLADLARELDDLQALSTHFSTHAVTHLRLLASPRDTVEGDQVTPEQMGRVMVALRRRFEVVVVDLPSILDLMTLTVLDLTDRIFLITEPVAPTVVATARCLELLGRQGLAADRLELVLNRAGEGDGRLADRLIEEQLGRAIDHRVPEDRAVIAAVNRGEPAVVVRQQGPFAEAASELAEAAVRVVRRSSVGV